MSLPEPGDLNWGTPLNDAILSAQADAAQAKSDASTARSTAIEARQTAVEVKEFVEAPTAEQFDALLPDKISDDADPVGAAVDAVAQARAAAAEQAAKDASIPVAEKDAPEGVAPLDGDSRVPQGNLPEHLTPTALSASTEDMIQSLAALVVDMDGNPLGAGHVVIKVDTANGNEINDIVWEATL